MNDQNKNPEEINSVDKLSDTVTQLNELLNKQNNEEKNQEDNPITKKNTISNEPYKLHIGDTLEVSLLDEPEMTREVTVIADGTISYLLVGRVKARERTLDELRQELTKKLEEFFVAPYVSILTIKVFETQNDVNTVSILGALAKPGSYQIKKNERLLDLLAKAGGLLYTQTEFGSRTTANLKASYISRNKEKLKVDFFKLVQNGDMNENILLEPGDFIYIANAEDENIVVMGEVNRPKIIPYTRDVSLIEALSMCQGFTREAYQSRVVIIRPGKDKSKFLEVNVNDLLLGRDVRNITLKGGDIVFVPEQGISEYARYSKFIVDIMEVVLKGYQVREAILFPKLNRNDSR
jgi:polysaccharide export outer membrane protein